MQNPWSWARILATGCREDYRRLGFMVAAYLGTAVVPRRWDRRFLTRLLSTSFGVRPGCVARTGERMKEILEPFRAGEDWESYARASCAFGRENQWIHGRALHGRKASVETSVEGLEHLRHARACGKGVILWGLSFCETLVSKLALWRAGVRMVHLSSADHGLPLPPTEFGLKVVGPLHCAAENRFLAERVVMPLDGTLGYMKTLLARLEANACVHIAGERRSSRNNVRARLLGRTVLFAPGAPGLSLRVGSPLLPLYTTREGLLRYRVVIDEPIEPPRSLPKKEFIQRAVDEFASRVEKLVLERPECWDLWRFRWPFWVEEDEEAGASPGG